MAVTLTVNETIDPSSSIADALEGGGTGVDLGSVSNNSFAPIVDKTLNQGAQDLYIVHDATVDPITDTKTFIQTYGTGTGFTYGGADSAANDYALMTSLGNASGGSKNNADGLSGGLWIDHDAFSNDSNRFDQAGRPTVVYIYGDGGTQGIDLASAVVIGADAMVYNAPGETDATAPVAGQIGKSADTALGDNAHIKLRIYLPNSHTQGGIIQWEWVIAYSFTA